MRQQTIAGRARFPTSLKLDNEPGEIVIGSMTVCCLGRVRCIADVSCRGVTVSAVMCYRYVQVSTSLAVGTTLRWCAFTTWRGVTVSTTVPMAVTRQWTTLVVWLSTPSVSAMLVSLPVCPTACLPVCLFVPLHVCFLSDCLCAYPMPPCLLQPWCNPLWLAGLKAPTN